MASPYSSDRTKGESNQQHHNTGRAKPGTVEDKVVKRTFQQFKDEMPMLRLCRIKFPEGLPVEMDLSSDEGLVLKGEEQHITAGQKAIDNFIINRFIKVDHKIDDLKKDILFQKEAMRYMQGVLSEITCYCKLKDGCIQITGLSDKSLEESKQLIDGSLHTHEISQEIDDTNLTVFSIEFPGKLLEVKKGKQRVIVFTDDIKERVEKFFKEREETDADVDREDVEEGRNSPGYQMEEKSRHKVKPLKVKKTADEYLSEGKKQKIIDIKAESPKDKNRSDGENFHISEHVNTLEQIEQGAMRKGVGKAQNVSQNIKESTSRTGEKSNGTGYDHNHRRTVNAPAEEVEVNRRTENTQPKPAGKGEDIRRNENTLSDHPTSAGIGYWKVRDRGFGQSQNAKPDSGQRLNAQPEDSSYHNEMQRNGKSQDRKHGAGSSLAAESSLKSFDDRKKTESLQVDVHVAEYLLSKPDNFISHFGVRARHDSSGVLTIEGDLQRESLEAARHGIEELARGIHTAEIYHKCVTRLRCVQSTEIKEYIDSIEQKGHTVWVEPVKPYRVLETFQCQNVTVKLFCGSVLDVTSDAIICPVTSLYQPSCLAAQQLFHQGGDELVQKIQLNKRNQPHPPKWFAALEQHSVKGTSYRSVCALVADDWYDMTQYDRDKMEKKLTHAIKELLKKGCNQLTIPVEMGSRIPPVRVVCVIVSSIQNFLPNQSLGINLCLTDTRYKETIQRILDKHQSHQHNDGSYEQLHSTDPDTEDEGAYLVQNNLVKEKADAIVCTVDHLLDLSKGAVSSVILKAGGRDIQAECRRNHPKGLGPTEVVTVGPGNLQNCQFLILGRLPAMASGYKGIECFKRLLENIFTAAKERQVQSLAMPALGAGALKYPVKMCVTEILRSVFIHAEDCGVRTVKVVVPPGGTALYEEFDKYFWTYENELRQINESLTEDETVLERMDTGYPLVTVSEYDRFGCLADVIIVQGPARKLGSQDQCVNSVVVEGTTEMSQPWVLKKMHIANNHGIHNQYADAFSITLEEQAQLVTLDLRHAELKDDLNVLKVIEILFKLLDSSEYPDPLKKINIIVTLQMKHALSNQLLDKPTSIFGKMASFVQGFIKKHWQEVKKPRKKALLQGVNVVLTSQQRTSDELQRVGAQLAERLQAWDEQYCVKNKPKVPERTYNKDAQDTDVDEAFNKSRERDENRQSLKPELPERRRKQDTDSMRQPFNRLEEDRGMADRQMEDLQVPHIIKTTISSDVCRRFSPKELQKFAQELQNEGIKSDLTDDGIDVHFSHRNIKKFQEILISMKTDKHNHPLDVPKVPEDIVKDTIRSKKEYIADSIEIPDDKISGIRLIIEKFEGENEDMDLKVDKNKLIVYCLPDKMAEIMHKLKVQLGMIKLTGRQGRKLGRFSSLIPEIDSSRAPPSVDQSRQSHSMVPSRSIYTPSVNKASHCNTYKVADNLKVKVYEGDLLALNVDCIVNVVQTNVGPETDLITKAAGEEVLKERERVSSFESLGEAACVITSAGQLKYKKLLHTTALEWNGPSEETKTRENLLKSLGNCLLVADRNKMRSIGIPALSPGDHAVPKEICAEEYCRGIEYFAEAKPNSLEEIHFIFPTGDMVETVSETFGFRFTIDQSAIATEIVQRTTNRAPSPVPTRRNRETRQEDDRKLRDVVQADQRRNIDRQRGNSGSSSSGAYEVSGIKVKVYSGNILQLDVACIVNAANEALEHGGGVARVIARAAGKDFQQESYRYIQKHGHLQITGCISTSGGNLKYSHVLHAVGPRWRTAKQEQRTREELRDTIVNTLLCAEQLGLPSVGIPSISAGIFGVPKNVCAEEYGKGILQFIESHDPQVLKEVHFVDVAPDIVRVVSDTFNKMFAEESAPTPKSREEKTRRETDQESCSMPKEKFSNAPRKSNQMTSGTAVFLPQSTDDTLDVNSLQKPRPQNFSVSLSTSKQASGERLVTFRRSLSSDTSVPESNTSSWSMWNSDEQSPTDEGLLPKDSSLSGSQRAFKSRSSSVKDSPEQTSTTEGLQPKDLSLSGSQRAYQSSNLARDMKRSESGQSSQGKLASEGRLQPITDATSDKAEAAGYGSRKNPYIFYPNSNSRLSVLVYKHDIAMCKVDAVVSVLEIPGRESSRIAQSVRKTVGAHNCPGRNEISKVRDLENIVTNLQHKDVKLDYQYVIHANTPRWKSNDEKFKRELKKCIENVFKVATTGKCSIGSIAIPVLGLVGSSGPRPELCCEVMADAAVSFCAKSSEDRGRLQEIHLIGYDEGLVYCLKEAVSAILDVPTSSSKIEGDWQVAKKKGSHR